jgi:hypothetical protein
MALLVVVVLSPFRAQAGSDQLAATLHGLAERMEVILSNRFELAGLEYPPRRIQLIALKQSRRLELWAYQEKEWRHVHDYRVFAASGGPGPKLQEGDKQVPEGFYRIVDLNPNSHFHLSLKINYPNSFDWLQALREGREEPGSNIFIHGSAWSSGCLAVGNRYIEELFYLVGKVGLEQVGVIIAPYDFRRREPLVTDEQPAWVERLYAHLRLRLVDFPLSEKRPACGFGCREMRAAKRRAQRSGEGHL